MKTRILIIALLGLLASCQQFKGLTYQNRQQRIKDNLRREAEKGHSYGQSKNKSNSNSNSPSKNEEAPEKVSEDTAENQSSLGVEEVVIDPNKKLTPQEYIAYYKGYAIASMKKKGVPASITLAQGLLESGVGNSRLAREANNHFGVKCGGTWDGPSVRHDDDAKQECFRKYRSVLHSYEDHGDFLRSRSWYASLFELKITNYKGWAYGLKKAGYATDPQYPKKLINIIEKYKLNQYDRM